MMLEYKQISQDIKVLTINDNINKLNYNYEYLEINKLAVDWDKIIHIIKGLYSEYIRKATHFKR